MSIGDLNIIAGQLPAKVRGLVQEWAEEHRAELLNIWETGEFRKIDPLV
jgi:hypothetical protein